MKYLAIDYGEKRTGIAVSDSGGSMAFARTTIHKITRDGFWKDLLAVMEKEGAEALVIGMPKIADGRETEIVRRIRNFTASLRRRSDLPLYLMEETLSSFEAELKLRETKKNRSGLDGAAAAGILESFLHLPEEQREQRRL